MCGRYYPLSRGKTEPSMPSTILATNSLHTAPACSLSMLSLTNTTSSEDRNTASSKSSSRKGRRYRKASIAIFHLSNPYPSKCYKTPMNICSDFHPRHQLFCQCRRLFITIFTLSRKLFVPLHPQIIWSYVIPYANISF